ncbi:MAG: hypothetical protein LBG94_06515 [Treponema sp.]|jgi:Leucine-rich repeat (LRR) protein|nr:hypothetical protein [Treponema sp.]
MPKEINKDELDLHYTDGDPDLGIAPEGVECKNLDEISKRIAKVKDTVKIINLDNQHALTEIPSVLGKCTALEDLNISHTDIKEIPDFIFNLPSLRSLSCRCSEIPAFPLGLLNAGKLESLYIRMNKDWVLPEQITSLKSLKVLALDLYSDASLPDNLGGLSGLEDLAIMVKYDERTVPSLPESFKNHSSLKKIHINDLFYKNRKTFDLEQAAKILSTCPALESLKMSGVDVGKGHHNILLLTGLKELELRHLITEGKIFDSITGLNKLQRLCILGSEFKIKEIPDIFANMKALNEFTFAGNMVMDVPPSIYTLRNLKTFEFGCTAISQLDKNIANLQNLENIHIHDNLLERLPENIFSLPKLKLLNIEENIFTPGYINAVKTKIESLAQKGRKIEFFYDRQGHRQAVKKLRALRDIDRMDVTQYAKLCLGAVIENPYAVKYINIAKLKGSPHYANICMAAAEKTCSVLENIVPEALGKQNYFSICMEAAKCPDIGSYFKLIRDDLLSYNKYIQVCMQAALSNKSADFLSNFNTDAFQKRYGREIYEHICWAAVLHNPRAIGKMISPTKEIHNIATKQ